MQDLKPPCRTERVVAERAPIVRVPGIEKLDSGGGVLIELLALAAGGRADEYGSFPDYETVPMPVSRVVDDELGRRAPIGKGPIMVKVEH
ncbi:protein of unknown function [Acidithiobacillus ferrivorans]|uniref:Uncharacterized protein n=1 Tax=Acidithiobacillus ferrivorans TaxID=160808 RepID=A0ABY1MP89_9PROT|nr:protein of unknown function [Acidithiobacillus ferrivorans]